MGSVDSSHHCIMKVLVIFGVIAAALAAPLPEAESGAGVVVAHHGAVAPLGYALPAAHAAVAPVATAAVAPIAPVAYAAHAAVAPVATAAVAPVSYAAPAAVAPVATAAVAPVSYAAPAAVATHAAVAPVAYAAPAPAVVQTHSVATPVALPPKEVKVPITTHHYEIPVHQKVHYGTQACVAGQSTTIHKPSLAAPAIAPPSALLPKVSYNAPEITHQTQEIPVERHTPNFVDTPYHAGTIVEYTEPEIREVKVPTPVAQPVAVPHPVPYAAPYAVPKPYAVPQEIHSVAVHQPVNYGLVHNAAIPAATVVKAEY